MITSLPVTDMTPSQTQDPPPSVDPAPSNPDS
jgi:hypothetical protein